MQTDRTAAAAILGGGVAVGWLLADVLRLWLPTVLLRADAAGTVAPVRGAPTALALIVLVVLVATVVVVVHPRVVWVAAAGTAVLARVALAATDGGPGLALASGAGVVAGGVALAVLAAGSDHAAAARFGVLGGTAGSAAVHAVLRTFDLALRPGPLALLGSAVVVAGGTWALARASRYLDRPTAPPAWPWAGLGAALLLGSVLVAPPGRVAVATGWSPAGVAVAAVGLQVLIMAGVWAGPRVRPALGGPAGAGLALVGSAAALPAADVGAVVGQALLALGIGLVIGAMPRVGDGTAPVRRAVAVAAGLLAAGLVATSYYAAYVVRLPGNNRAALLGTALALGAMGLVAGRDATRRAVAPHSDPTSDRAMVLAILLATLLVIAVPRGTPTASPDAGRGPLSLVVADVAAGHDGNGRFTAPALADAVAELDADVMVATGVDRGWLVGGQHDVAAVLEDGTGLVALFAPAADEVMGNAVLTRLPVAEVLVERLPRGRDPMERSVIAVVLDRPDGSQVAIVGTHLAAIDEQGETRLPQAQAVAGVVARLLDRGLPVVLAGTLNAGPDAPELATFGGLVVPALPPDLLTHPASTPTARLTHVLVSEGLVVRSARALEQPLGPHRILHVVIAVVGTPPTAGSTTAAP